MSTRSVRVDLGERSYDVLVGPGALGEAAGRVRAILPAARRAFLVVDAGVEATHGRAMGDALSGAGFSVRACTVEATEAGKSLATFGRVLGELAATGQERAEPVVAVGGGIVGDVAGFVAASYRRGVPVVQCPTTLLSMVDASVGGKTGVNLELPGGQLAKNMAGAFHQPVLVSADVATLGTLPARHLRAGLGECIKHAMIAGGLFGEDLLGWLEGSVDSVLRGDAASLTELVARNVTVKARVVEGDEFETAPTAAGGRALLNLGHTFGHAIETLPRLSPDPGDPSLAPLHHGEAVGLGLAAACGAAASLGLIDEAYAARVRALLTRAGLPASVAGLPGDAALLERMGHDKKVRGGVLRLVLPDGVGSARVVEGPASSAVSAGWAAIREG